MDNMFVDHYEETKKRIDEFVKKFHEYIRDIKHLIRELTERVDAHDVILADHEERIRVLEEWVETVGNTFNNRITSLETWQIAINTWREGIDLWRTSIEDLDLASWKSQMNAWRTQIDSLNLAVWQQSINNLNLASWMANIDAWRTTTLENRLDKIEADILICCAAPGTESLVSDTYAINTNLISMGDPIRFNLIAANLVEDIQFQWGSHFTPVTVPAPGWHNGTFEVSATHSPAAFMNWVEISITKPSTYYLVDVRFIQTNLVTNPNTWSQATMQQSSTDPNVKYVDVTITSTNLDKIPYIVSNGITFVLGNSTNLSYETISTIDPYHFVIRLKLNTSLVTSGKTASGTITTNSDLGVITINYTEQTNSPYLTITPNTITIPS
jgi:hypothetical protein